MSIQATTKPCDIAAIAPRSDPRAVLASASEAEAPRKFQALLATMLVKEMRGSMAHGLFGEGAEGDVYGGWFDEQVGESLARDDALHLESMLRASLERKSRMEAA